MTTLDAAIAARVRFGPDGLVPTVVQDRSSAEVLMVAWMDAEALARTLAEGRAWYWSRSRAEYWRKGDTSGHVQYVRDLAVDCDGDTLLLTVDQLGPACHTGTRTCFAGRSLVAGGPQAGAAEADNADTHGGGAR